MFDLNINNKINEQILDFEEEIKKYPHHNRIESRMKDAKKAIDYDFQNIGFLKLAFCRTKIDLDAGKNNKTYKNDTLAQIGDAVLDTIISERYFAEGKTKKI